MEPIYIPGRGILARTADVFLSLPFAGRVIIALAADDELFDKLDISRSPKVVRVTGGAERSDSVLAGLRASEIWREAPTRALRGRAG